MGVIGRWSLGLLLVAGLGAALSYGLLMLAASNRQDAFVLENGALAEPDFLAERRDHLASDSDPRLGVHAHRLVAGSGTVYAVRRYSPGDAMMIDDERYEKLTVWTAAPVPSGTITLSLDRPDAVIAVHANGGSAWPRSGCAQFVKDGRVSISREHGSFRVIVSGRLQPASGYLRQASCLEGPFLQTFFASPISFDRVTPWLGRAGDHPYNETYR